MPSKHHSSIYTYKCICHSPNLYGRSYYCFTGRELGVQRGKATAQAHTAYTLMGTFFAFKFFSGNKEIMKSPVKQLSSFSSGDERSANQVCATLLPLSCRGRTQPTWPCCVSASPISTANSAPSSHQDSCHHSTKFRIPGSSNPLNTQNYKTTLEGLTLKLTNCGKRLQGRDGSRAPSTFR